MKEIENTRNQIQPADVQEFDERIKPIQDEVLDGVSSFREVQQMYTREKQDKEPKRMPFAKNRHTGNDGIMCTYKASVVKCQLIPLIVPRSTLDGRLDQYSVDTDLHLVSTLDRFLVLGQQLVASRKNVNQLIYRSTLILTACL